MVVFDELEDFVVECGGVCGVKAFGGGEIVVAVEEVRFERVGVEFDCG